MQSPAHTGAVGGRRRYRGGCRGGTTARRTWKTIDDSPTYDPRRGNLERRRRRVLRRERRETWGDASFDGGGEVRPGFCVRVQSAGEDARAPNGGGAFQRNVHSKNCEGEVQSRTRAGRTARRHSGGRPCRRWESFLRRRPGKTELVRRQSAEKNKCEIRLSMHHFDMYM